jgi:hypothetical protein
MNVIDILWWIRLLAQVILDVFGDPNGGPGSGGRFVGPVPEMKPERIQIWLGILAQAAIEAIDEVLPEEGEVGPEMKPERIQFWLRLIARFVLAVIDGASGETGKSGESAAGPNAAGW